MTHRQARKFEKMLENVYGFIFWETSEKNVDKSIEDRKEAHKKLDHLWDMVMFLEEAGYRSARKRITPRFLKGHMESIRVKEC